MLILQSRSTKYILVAQISKFMICQFYAIEFFPISMSNSQGLAEADSAAQGAPKLVERREKIITGCSHQHRPFQHM